MLKEVNIEAIRKYNSDLKVYKEQASKLEIEMEVNKKELKSLCEQLSTELGILVTEDNIEDIYNEQVDKINKSLETGTTILNKIKQEANGGVNNGVQSVGHIDVNGGMNTGVSQTPPVPQAPIFNSSTPSAMPSSLPNPGQTINGNVALFSV